MASRGRPCRVPGERARHRIAVTLTDRERDSVRRAARDSGLSVADMLRIALLEFFDDEEPGGPSVLVLVNGPSRTKIYRRVKFRRPSTLKELTGRGSVDARRPESERSPS
jgi:hypothetical protein